MGSHTQATSLSTLTYINNIYPHESYQTSSIISVAQDKLLFSPRIVTKQRQNVLLHIHTVYLKICLIYNCTVWSTTVQSSLHLQSDLRLHCQLICQWHSMPIVENSAAPDYIWMIRLIWSYTVSRCLKDLLHMTPGMTILNACYNSSIALKL